MPLTEGKKNGLKEKDAKRKRLEKEKLEVTDEQKDKIIEDNRWRKQQERMSSGKVVVITII